MMKMGNYSLMLLKLLEKDINIPHLYYWLALAKKVDKNPLSTFYHISSPSKNVHTSHNDIPWKHLIPL